MNNLENYNFKTPSEELEYLRSKVNQKIETLGGINQRFENKDIVSKVVNEYSIQPTEKFLHNEMILPAQQKITLIEGLKSKNTDQQLQEIILHTIDKGIKNMIHVVEDMHKPELEDDFHRFLIQYVLSGRDDELSKLSKQDWKSLQNVLYEVILPYTTEEGKNVREFVSAMERFYATMLSITSSPENKDGDYYSMELALANGSNDLMFYVAVNRKVADIFEKLVIGLFPNIRVSECKEDYNIFHDDGYQIYAYAKLKSSPAFPIMVYTDFESDTIAPLISSFTKLKKMGEGAAMQILVRPCGDKFTKKFTKYLDELRKGDTFKRILNRDNFIKGFIQEISDVLKNKEDKEKEKEKTNKLEDENAIKNITKKIESTIVETNLRIIVNAETRERAESILHEIESAFHQYTEQKSNSIIFEKSNHRNLYDKLHNFIYRKYEEDESMPLSLRELTTLYHYPLYVKDLVQLRSAESAQAPAPLDLKQEGVLLGLNKYKHLETKIYQPREDRMRHTYVIGQTGTGKTTILKNLIIQDIKNGDGCCFIDPHGSDIEDILANVPPERHEDVIYFDPAYTARPMGLNMLEYDLKRPDQKIFVVNELISIFKKLFAESSPESMGPAFEQYFRNTALLVMEHPESGMTLLDLTRVLSDKEFRDYKLSKCKNPLILQFWKNAEATTGDQGLENYVPYISSKFDVFLSNDIMRPIIAQEKSAFDFRKIMDEKKIFLVNLSKGRLGDINAHLIGLILVGKFLQATLSRVDSNQRPDFYLYIDEFQNVTTPSISAILSEARKYRLSLNIAHQYIGQLPEDIKNAVFGNVGTKIVYRVGTEDAKFLESEFEPVFNASDIIRIENYNSYVKLLSDNKPQRPFSMIAFPSPKGSPNQNQPIKELSYIKYGRDANEVNNEILKRWEVIG